MYFSNSMLLGASLFLLQKNLIMTPTEINKTNELMGLIGKLEAEIKRLSERLNNAAKHSKMLEKRILIIEQKLGIEK